MNPGCFGRRTALLWLAAVLFLSACSSTRFVQTSGPEGDVSPPASLVVLVGVVDDPETGHLLQQSLTERLRAEGLQVVSSPSPLPAEGMDAAAARDLVATAHADGVLVVRESKREQGLTVIPPRGSPGRGSSGEVVHQRPPVIHEYEILVFETELYADRPVRRVWSATTRTHVRGSPERGERDMVGLADGLVDSLRGAGLISR